MMIQGERIYPLGVEKVVDNIFGNSQHGKRKQSLANAALGIIESASLIVHRIGLGLSAAKKLLGKHAVKQVDRLLSNSKLFGRTFGRTKKCTRYFMGCLKNGGIREAINIKNIWPDNLYLYIYGMGPMLSLILKAAEKNTLIQYKGFLDDEKNLVYAKALFSLIPKNNLFDRHKTGLSPIKLYESLAHSTPVIVTDLSYMSNIVSKNNLGLVVPYESPVELAKAVRLLYENKALRDHFSENAYQFILNGNTWDDRANQVHQIICKLSTSSPD